MGAGGGNLQRTYAQVQRIENTLSYFMEWKPWISSDSKDYFGSRKDFTLLLYYYVL